MNHWVDFTNNFVSICAWCIQLSYIVVDLLIWWGIRSYINNFRKRKLKLAPIAYFSTYRGSISHLPTGYMWSPHLVPKPEGRDHLVCTIIYVSYQIILFWSVLTYFIALNNVDACFFFLLVWLSFFILV